MTLPLGTKIVVIGGANARKVGYIVGETSCHYHLVLIANEKADIERSLDRALVKLRDTTNEIDELFRRMTGIKIAHSRAFAEGKKQSQSKA
jgi:hypothetical protein